MAPQRASGEMRPPYRFTSDADITEPDDCSTDVDSQAPSSSRSSGNDSSAADKDLELAKLRSENAGLRGQNEQLKRGSLFEELFNTPASSQLAVEHEIFDNPFEPPPESPRCYWGVGSSPAGSTCAPSDPGFFSSGFATPSSSASGAATPAITFPAAHVPTQFCVMVPVWFDRTRIPCGIVQQARALFEKPQAAMPSFFCGGVVAH